MPSTTEHMLGWFSYEKDFCFNVRGRLITGINICQAVFIIHDSEQKDVSLLKIIKFDSRPNHTALPAITSGHCNEDAAL
jgi:hypothetical protein